MPSNEMTYIEYEKIAKGYLERSLRVSTGKIIKVNHQANLKSIEGETFNIDLSYELEIGGLKYLTLVECKHWANPVNRDVIVLFEHKRIILKAQKAVVITSSYFQSGALEFARINNIGLIQITNKGEINHLNHFTGNFNSLKERLRKDVCPLTNSKDIIEFGIVSPRQSLRDYFLDKFGTDLMEIEADAECGTWRSQNLKNPYERLRKIPKDWDRQYVLKETAGLPLVLENEPEIRIVSMWINLSIQDNWA